MVPDLTCVVDAALARYPAEESALVMVLQDIQAELRYLPVEAMARVAEALDVPAARVYAVATFYKVFSLEPQGRCLVQVCKGTACHVRGAQLVEEELCRYLDLPAAGTTEDLEYTIKTVNCVGACAMAPVVIVGDEYHAKAKASAVGKLLGAGDSDEED